MRRDLRTYLWDAVAALDSISNFVRSRSYADYDADELLRSAVERKFEIVGEALNQLSKIDGELAARIPGLRQIVGFRNILIHGYAHVDNVRVRPASVPETWAPRPPVLPSLSAPPAAPTATTSTLVTPAGTVNVCSAPV